MPKIRESNLVTIVFLPVTQIDHSKFIRSTTKLGAWKYKLQGEMEL